MAMAACGNNMPIVPILATPTFFVPPTAHPTSVVPSAATQTPMFLPNPTLLPSIALTSQIYNVSVPGVFVNHLALDGNYLYWTTEAGSDLFRYPLVSSTSTLAAIVAKTHFDKGTLSKYPNNNLSRVGA